MESGQDKLLKALRDLPRVGTIKTPDSLAYALQDARRIPTGDGGERVVLVTDRYISFWEAVNQTRTLENYGSQPVRLGSVKREDK